MKKKIYFSISSIIQILLSIISIINVKSIIQSQIDMIAESSSSLPVDMAERITKMYTSNSAIVIIILASIIQIVLNAIILRAAIKNTIVRNKGRYIAFSVICFFFAESFLISILAFVNFVVLLCLERKNPEDFPVKRKIPELEYVSPSKKHIIIGIVLLLLYFSNFLIAYFLKTTTSTALKAIIPIAFYIIIFVAFIIYLKDIIKKDFKIFKENWKAYISFILPRLGIMYLIYYACNIICVLLSHKAVSENQSLIEALPLWLTFPLAVIWAPIVEEGVFRFCIRNFIKNKIVFIVLSSLIFGLIHCIHESSIVNIILTAIPYSILGGFMAYLYAKTNNATCNILAHAFHNFLAMLISTILLVFAII